jgi:hypothetical protein
VRLGVPTARRGRGTLILVGVCLAIFAIGAVIAVNIRAHDDTLACQQEYKTVQSAIDAYMAYFNLATVTAGSTENKTTKSDEAHALFQEPTSPLYVMNTPTVYKYTWDSRGRITIISQSSGGPSVPSGCAPSGG